MSLPLAELYAQLRADGFAVGVDDHVRIGRLLAGDPAWTLDKLRFAIAALVITAPHEQAAFDACWERWLHSAAQPPPPPPPEPPRPRRRRLRIGLELAALALVASGALVLRLREDQPVGPTQTISTTETLPASTASCPLPPAPEVESDAVIMAGYVVAGLGAAALLTAAVGAAFAARARRRFVPGPWRYALAVPPTTRAVLPRRAIEDAAADLTGRVHERGDELDVPRSVDATATLGGLPTPIYRSPLVAPRYLVLQDSAGGADRWSFLYDELVRGLVREGVEIERYRFAATPERCVAADGRSAALDELIDHVDALIAIGDGDAAVDPLTGERAPWLATLRRIPQRLWVNPLPPARWRAGALAIAADTPMAHGAAGALAALHGVARGAPDRAFPAVIERAPGTGSAVDGLRVALGPRGFALVAAVAVAGPPTLATARWLADAHGFALDERDWLAIATLPWLRTEQWPDGLRDRLRDALATDNPPLARAVADTAGRLVAASEPPRASGAHLAWQLDVVTRAAQRGDRAAAARTLGRIARTPLAPYARSALATLRLRDRGRLALRWTVFAGAILLVSGVSFALTTARLRAQAAAARIAARHLIKLAGDGARLTNWTEAFAVCVVDSNGAAVPGARVVWSQPQLGSRKFIGTTSKTGVSRATQIYLTAPRNDLEEIAQYITGYTGPQFTDGPLVADGERVVFRYAQVTGGYPSRDKVSPFDPTVRQQLDRLISAHRAEINKCLVPAVLTGQVAVASAAKVAADVTATVDANGRLTSVDTTGLGVRAVENCISNVLRSQSVGSTVDSEGTTTIDFGADRARGDQRTQQPMGACQFGVAPDGSCRNDPSPALAASARALAPRDAGLDARVKADPQTKPPPDADDTSAGGLIAIHGCFRVERIASKRYRFVIDDVEYTRAAPPGHVAAIVHAVDLGDLEPVPVQLPRTRQLSFVVEGDAAGAFEVTLFMVSSTGREGLPRRLDQICPTSP